MKSDTYLVGRPDHTVWHHGARCGQDRDINNLGNLYKTPPRQINPFDQSNSRFWKNRAALTICDGAMNLTNLVVNTDSRVYNQL